MILILFKSNYLWGL